MTILPSGKNGVSVPHGLIGIPSQPQQFFMSQFLHMMTTSDHDHHNADHQDDSDDHMTFPPAYDQRGPLEIVGLP